MECGTCGRIFRPKRSAAGGRPAKHCPRCRKSRGVARDPKIKVRELALRKAKRKLSRAVLTAEHEDRLFRLAAALSVRPEPAQAAAYAGLVLAPKELAELAELAAARDIANPDDLRAAAAHVRYAMLLVAHELARSASVVNPSYAGMSIRGLGSALELLRRGGTPVFSTVELQFAGPDGKPISPAKLKPKEDDD